MKKTLSMSTARADSQETFHRPRRSRRRIRPHPRRLPDTKENQMKKIDEVAAQARTNIDVSPSKSALTR